MLHILFVDADELPNLSAPTTLVRLLLHFVVHSWFCSYWTANNHWFLPFYSLRSEKTQYSMLLIFGANCYWCNQLYDTLTWHKRTNWTAARHHPTLCHSTTRLQQRCLSCNEKMWINFLSSLQYCLVAITPYKSTQASWYQSLLGVMPPCFSWSRRTRLGVSPLTVQTWWYSWAKSSDIVSKSFCAVSSEDPASPASSPNSLTSVSNSTALCSASNNCNTTKVVWSHDS